MIRTVQCCANFMKENVFRATSSCTVIFCPTSYSGQQRNEAHTPFTQFKLLHTSRPCQIKTEPPENWLKYNQVVFPPTKDGEPERPAEVYHQRCHIRYQQQKMLYLCRMVRGMSVDEAKKQLPFKQREGAQILKEIIEEAQDLAVEKHNVEYRSNLWIAEAFPAKAGHLAGIRKHAKTHKGIVHYKFIHVFIKLREGLPPEHYYAPKLTGHEHKANYISDMRNRKIYHSL
ncbi:large ribosomal subunit protein uL22m-like [Watersipora subatra]|uniref:large ribosomal subunit protein uL22m-like n=1 Tax=Watersipora subatra TaxID=2589382 RepID=UPI00355C9DED